MVASHWVWGVPGNPQLQSLGKKPRALHRGPITLDRVIKRQYGDQEDRETKRRRRTSAQRWVGSQQAREVVRRVGGVDDVVASRNSKISILSIEYLCKVFDDCGGEYASHGWNMAHKTGPVTAAQVPRYVSRLIVDTSVDVKGCGSINATQHRQWNT